MKNQNEKMESNEQLEDIGFRTTIFEHPFYNKDEFPFSVRAEEGGRYSLWILSEYNFNVGVVNYDVLNKLVDIFREEVEKPEESYE